MIGVNILLYIKALNNRFLGSLTYYYYYYYFEGMYNNF